MAMHLFEGLVPTGPGFGSRPDKQLSLLNNEVNRSVQLTLLDDEFGNPDPFGGSDSYEVRFHFFTLALMVSESVITLCLYELSTQEYLTLSISVTQVTTGSLR
jgi:hypothetical protein